MLKWLEMDLLFGLSEKTQLFQNDEKNLISTTFKKITIPIGSTWLPRTNNHTSFNVYTSLNFLSR